MNTPSDHVPPPRPDQPDPQPPRPEPPRPEPPRPDPPEPPVTPPPDSPVPPKPPVSPAPEPPKPPVTPPPDRPGPPEPPREPPPHQPPPMRGSSDDRNIALLTHLSGFLFSIIVPLIVWLVHRDRHDKAYLLEESREALNFQITVLIGYVICWILTFIVIGAFLGWLLWIANLVFCIIAAVRTSSGEHYRYPFNLRLIH